MRIAFALSLAVVAFALAGSGQAAEEEKKSETVSGSFGCAHCNFEKETAAKKCGAAFKSGDTVYLIKAAEGADASVAKQLKAFKKSKGEFEVTGKVEEQEGHKVLIAEAVKAKEGGEGGQGQNE